MKTPKIDFKNPKVQIGMLLVLIGFLLAYVVYTNVIVVISEEKAQLEKVHADRQAELNNIYAMMPQLKKLRRDVEIMNGQLDSLRSIFPDGKEVPRLLREITRVSRESGVFTTSFVPDSGVVKEYYIENNYKVSVMGGYHQLAMFFSYLADLDLIVNISKVKLLVNPAISVSIKDYETHGGTVQSVYATFRLTTFSSRK